MAGNLFCIFTHGPQLKHTCYFPCTAAPDTRESLQDKDATIATSSGALRAALASLKDAQAQLAGQAAVRENEKKLQQLLEQQVSQLSAYESLHQVCSY